MILQEGNKVLVVHRRLYETDDARFFIGTVDGYEAGIAKVSGYSLVKDSFSGELIEREDQKTKIFAISSGTLIVYELPMDVKISDLRFEVKEGGKLWLTDGKNLMMDLSERE